MVTLELRNSVRRRILVQLVRLETLALSPLLPLLRE